MASTCVYAANRLGEIADNIADIDNALKWGFGWEMGPLKAGMLWGLERASIAWRAWYKSASLGRKYAEIWAKRIFMILKSPKNYPRANGIWIASNKIIAK